MVETARRTKRLVQVGIHRRSASYCKQAAEFFRSGAVGQVTVAHAARVANEYARGIGRIADTDPPPGVAWDLFLEPAPAVPYNENSLSYKFRWLYDYSGGQLTDNGVHFLDLIQWGLGRDAPLSVTAVGGKCAVQDDRHTVDTIGPSGRSCPNAKPPCRTRAATLWTETGTGAWRIGTPSRRPTGPGRPPTWPTSQTSSASTCAATGRSNASLTAQRRTAISTTNAGICGDSADPPPDTVPRCPVAGNRPAFPVGPNRWWRTKHSSPFRGHARTLRHLARNTGTMTAHAELHRPDESATTARLPGTL